MTNRNISFSSPCIDLRLTKRGLITYANCGKPIDYLTLQKCLQYYSRLLMYDVEMRKGVSQMQCDKFFAKSKELFSQIRTIQDCFTQFKMFIF